MGTRKGSFIISSEPACREWDGSGIHRLWFEVFYMSNDHRNGGRILSKANSMIWCPQLEYTTDRVATWTPSQQKPQFTDDDSQTVKRL